LPLAGGGTDLDSYYLGRGTSWISVSIDKYCYSIINRRFDSNFLIKYSKLEEVSSIDEIKHNLIRETLRFFNVNDKIELTFVADIPGSTGLGSSSAFVVSLVTSLNQYLKLNYNNQNIAEISTMIERDILHEPIGLQDQYTSALGGLKQFDVSPVGEVSFQNLPIALDKLESIQDSLVLIYTGIKRDSKSILSKQVRDTIKIDSNTIKRLDFVKTQVPFIREALLCGDTKNLGLLFHEHWMMKSIDFPEMTCSEINEMYTKSLKIGGLGGKLIGAGGGGFLLVVVNDKRQFENNATDENLITVPFNFEMNGSTILVEK
jgi:D-glycero-alpha-D-manno-heptose-7-phosphate kinase